MDKLVATFTKTFSGLLNSIKSHLKSLLKVLNKPYQYISKFTSNIFKTLLRKPKDRKDYVSIGKLLVSKKLLIIISIAFVIVVYCLIAYVYPWADGVLWTANVNVSSEKYKNFSGKVKVHDVSGKVIFEGKMENGSIEGYGKQYNSAGELIYKGNYEQGKFSGQGEAYQNGSLLYKGNFKNNLYEGEGEIYAENGTMIYSGSFVGGQKTGKGNEYTASKGLLSYYGDFANDKREGSGKAYDEDGKTVIYEGQFAADEYQGQGKAYKDNKLIYSGAFEGGQYQGEGIFYDIETGNMIYNGSFVGGLYEGEGKLYDPKTSVKIYEGAFEAGKRQGKGTSYDRLGTVSFTGDFKDDSVDYVSYIGKTEADIIKDFSKESYRTEIKNNLILTYSNLNASMIFDVNAKNSGYVLTKVILGNKIPFLGINSTSTPDEINEILGFPYSTAKFSFDNIYQTVFSQLRSNLKGVQSTQSVKYLMSNYFIRLYYSQNNDIIECIEIGTI